MHVLVKFGSIITLNLNQMKSKKHILALALLGCVFFTASADNIIDLNDQTKTAIDGRKIKIPKNG